MRPLRILSSMFTLFRMKVTAKDVAAIRTKNVAARITPAEERAWDAFRKKLGGGVRPLSDADALRYAMALACKDERLPWPEGAS